MKRIAAAVFAALVILTGCTRVEPMSSFTDVEAVIFSEELSGEMSDGSVLELMSSDRRFKDAVVNEFEKSGEKAIDAAGRILWQGFDLNSGSTKALCMMEQGWKAMAEGQNPDDIDRLWSSSESVDFSLFWQGFESSEASEKLSGILDEDFFKGREGVRGLLAALHPGFSAFDGSVYHEIKTADGQYADVYFKTESEGDIITFTRTVVGKNGSSKAEFVYQITDHSVSPLRQDCTYDEYGDIYVPSVLLKWDDGSLIFCGDSLGCRIYAGETVIDAPEWPDENPKIVYKNENETYIGFGQSPNGFTSVGLIKNDGNGYYTAYFCDFNDGRFEEGFFPKLETIYDEENGLIILKPKDSRDIWASCEVGLGREPKECYYVNAGGFFGGKMDIDGNICFSFPLEYKYENADGQTVKVSTGIAAETAIYFDGSDFVFGYKNDDQPIRICNIDLQ